MSYKIEVTEEVGRTTDRAVYWAETPEQVADMSNELRKDIPRGSQQRITVTEQ